MVAYDKALQLWGAARLRAAGHRVDLEDDVRVDFEFDVGMGCETCGESPRADVVIWSSRPFVRHAISADDFDFATVLGEIVAAGGGTITADA